MSVESFITHQRQAFLSRQIPMQPGAGDQQRETESDLVMRLRAMRSEAQAVFERQGVPTIRNEEWKYTNLMPLFSQEYQFLPQELEVASREDQFESQVHNLATSDGVVGLSHADILASIDHLRASLPPEHTFICLVNGVHVSALTTLADKGLHVATLTDDVIATNEDVARTLGSIATVETHPFAAMNTAMMHDGVLIRIDRNHSVGAPIHIAHVSVAPSMKSGTTVNVVATPRVLILAGEGSQATIIESFHTIGDGAALVSSVTEVSAARNSNVRLIRIHDDAGNSRLISFVGGEVMRDATFTTDALCINADFVRNDLHVRLVEENAQAYLNGVSALNETQFADNHTVVDHVVPHCHSEELYKGVYDGKSTGVFNGKIFVRPQAQKTTAYQSNHSILLSDRATVYAKPQLEIWADDVKCSHGATTGQLDEEAIYYLRSRGIGHDDARAMMTFAFAAEVVERLPLDGLRTHIEHRIAEKLGAVAYSEEVVVDE